MAKPQTPFSIVAPGSLGLNTKSASLDLGPLWATDTKNAVIATDGTIAAREGWQQTFETPLSGEPDVKSIHEYIDSSGNRRIIFAAGNKIYENENNPVDVTGTIPEPTDDNWKFVTFNNKCLGVQKDHCLIRKEDGGDFEEVNTDKACSSPYEILSAWGRVWIVSNNRQTIFYSDLLQEDTFNGGSSGLLDMQTVWSRGTDEIVALAEFNNLLVVMGRRQVVLFQGADNPNQDLAIVDIITNIGCIARDSVQNVGPDVLFLSEDGVISLARNLETGSLPISNVTENVSNSLALIIRSENTDNIKSVYNIEDGYYLITFPTSNRVYYLSFRYLTDQDRETEDISVKARISKPRITFWTDITPTAFHYTQDGRILLGKEGLVGRYTGYLDNGEEYDFEMKTGWFSGEGEIGTTKKIFKQASHVIRAGFSVVLVFEWYYDYQAVGYDSGVREIEANAAPSEYGIAEYGLSEYTANNFVSTLVYNMSGSGKTFRLGYRARINGSNLELQRTELFMKTGKINRRAR